MSPDAHHPHDADCLLRLDQVARLFSAREKKRVDVPRIVRYVTRGYKGVRLGAVQRGRDWLTSVAMVERFFAAVKGVK